MKRFTLFLLFSSVMLACQTYKQDRYVEQYVVESYQLANNPFAEIRISRTTPFDRTYDFSELAVSNVSVVVHLLDANHQPETTYTFFEQFPGIYRADDDQALVQPGRRYRLEATVVDDENHLIRAETFVPGAFEVVNPRVDPDTLLFQGPRQVDLLLTPSFYPGRRAYIIVNTVAQDTVNFGLTPLYRASFERSENPRLADFAKTTSNILTDANFDITPEGNLRVIYPWLGIAFYGPNRILLNFIDTNIYDFNRTQEAQFGGSTLSPGEINNVKSNVVGGIGLFGSYTQQSYDIFIRRNLLFN